MSFCTIYPRPVYTLWYCHIQIFIDTHYKLVKIKLVNIDLAPVVSYLKLVAFPSKCIIIQYHNSSCLNMILYRFAGWWGHERTSRFQMEHGNCYVLLCMHIKNDVLWIRVKICNFFFGIYLLTSKVEDFIYLEEKSRNAQMARFAFLSLFLLPLFFVDIFFLWKATPVFFSW